MSSRDRGHSGKQRRRDSSSDSQTRDARSVRQSDFGRGRSRSQSMSLGAQANEFMTDYVFQGLVDEPGHPGDSRGSGRGRSATMRLEDPEAYAAKLARNREYRARKKGEKRQLSEAKALRLLQGLDSRSGSCSRSQERRHGSETRTGRRNVASAEKTRPAPRTGAEILQAQREASARRRAKPGARDSDNAKKRQKRWDKIEREFQQREAEHARQPVRRSASRESRRSESREPRRDFVRRAESREPCGGSVSHSESPTSGRRGRSREQISAWDDPCRPRARSREPPVTSRPPSSTGLASSIYYSTTHDQGRGRASSRFPPDTEQADPVLDYHRRQSRSRSRPGGRPVEQTPRDYVRNLPDYQAPGRIGLPWDPSLPPPLRPSRRRGAEGLPQTREEAEQTRHAERGAERSSSSSREGGRRRRRHH